MTHLIEKHPFDCSLSLKSCESMRCDSCYGLMSDSCAAGLCQNVLLSLLDSRYLDLSIAFTKSTSQDYGPSYF